MRLLLARCMNPCVSSQRRAGPFRRALHTRSISNRYAHLSDRAHVLCQNFLPIRKCVLVFRPSILHCQVGNLKSHGYVVILPLYANMTSLLACQGHTSAMLCMLHTGMQHADEACKRAARPAGQCSHNRFFSVPVKSRSCFCILGPRRSPMALLPEWEEANMLAYLNIHISVTSLSNDETAMSCI